MDSSKIAKQMIDFQKTTFDNTFNAMVLLQEQAENIWPARSWISQHGCPKNEERRSIIG